MLSENTGETEYEIVTKLVSKSDSFSVGKYEEIVDVNEKVEELPGESSSYYEVTILKRA